MFDDIPRNIWRYSPECLRTFPGMFSTIPRNVWRHSAEYKIPSIPHVPCIPFPVPVFLVLYIAIDNYIKKLTVNFINESYFLYDKSNFIKETFITELNNKIIIYGFISYFNKKKQKTKYFK